MAYTCDGLIPNFSCWCSHSIKAKKYTSNGVKNYILFNMIIKIFALLIGLLTTVTSGLSQNASGDISFKKTMRVIVDNDFNGDPDGLFQLTQLLLSPSVETRAIIGSHLSAKDFIDPSEKQAENAAQKAKEVLRLLNMQNDIPVLAGSNFAMTNDSTPVKSEAVNFIIKEALRTDTKLPLYILCGAGLTEVASALLTNPAIAEKFTLIWIGGPEYPGIAFPPPKISKIEYNLNIDIAAAKLVFNKSTVALWQVPRDAYRQAIIPYSQLVLNVKSKGEIGNYLYQQLFQLMKKIGGVGETYILGDSPLVLLTALQTYFEPDPASSNYQKKIAPKINDQGQYEESQTGRTIRVYTKLDIALMFNDFFAKLELYTRRGTTK
jgi:purine nucleosidase